VYTIAIEYTTAQEYSNTRKNTKLQGIPKSYPISYCYYFACRPIAFRL